MALIYIVEDDENIREIETIALKNSNYMVCAFEKATTFYKKLEDIMPDQFNDICLIFIKQVIYNIIMPDDFLCLIHILFHICFDAADQHNYGFTRHLFDVIQIQHIRFF